MTAKDTIRLTVASDSVTAPGAHQVFSQGAEVILAGGTVAFPTETVYGLGANALDAHAIGGIFLAKQRPAWDPLIVHISEISMLSMAVQMSATAVSPKKKARIDRLMAAFWPGPLTLLLPKHSTLPDAVTAGRPLVGIRMPAHPVANALIAAAGVPIAAPSANRFGHTSPTTAQHVLEDLNGRIDMVMDAGASWCGVESTVIEVREQEIVLYRPGAIAAEEIEAVAGPVVFYRPPATSGNKTDPQSLPSPGVDMRHYAPKATVIPVEMGSSLGGVDTAVWLQTVAEHTRKVPAASRIGIMLPKDWLLPEQFSGVHYAWGDWKDTRELARRLFAGLRTLDAMGAEFIVCPLPPGAGIGVAIRDRLLKAARSQ